MIFLSVLVISAIIFILLTAKPSRIIYIRNLSIPAICLLFIICTVAFSKTAVSSALNGLILWSSIVVPSLFPFFVASDLMNSTGFTRAAGTLLESVMRPLFNVPGCASFALALGVTSGYPVGAKITADLRKDGSLTVTEAERLLAFTNNSGPLFIIGAVGTGMFGSPSIGIFLFICHLMSCLSVGFLFRLYKREPERIRKVRPVSGRSAQKRSVSSGSKLKSFLYHISEDTNKRRSFGELLDNAVRNSVSSILVIGGFIVLFSVIISLLDETGIIGAFSSFASYFLEHLFPGIELEELISGIFGGFFEITTGSRLISRAAHLPLQLKLPAVSFLIGWAGISVHFQVISIISGTDIDFRPYLLGKLIQGAIASIYTLIGIRFTNIESAASAPVLGNGSPALQGFWVIPVISAFLLITAVFSFRSLSGRSYPRTNCKNTKKKSSI